MAQAAQGLPARPNLEFLKKLAKRRLRVLRAGSPGGKTAKLADAQLAVAREHGFPSWRALVAHVGVAGIAPAGDSAALMQAIAKHDVEAVLRIAEESPSLVNASTAHPYWGGRPTPLQVAVEHADLGVVRVLLDAGADPSSAGEMYDGWTPLMLAVNWKNCAIEKELLTRGAKVGLIEALMLADDRRVAKILRDEPDSVTRKMPNDATPLHFARTAKSVRLLLDAGVSPAARDKLGKTPAEAIAFFGVDKEVVKPLLDGQDGLRPWVLAAVGAQSALRMAARKDPALLRDPSVMSAAITSGRLNIVKWLTAQGADVNARTARGDTMLHVAAWEGNPQIVKHLLSRGADRNAIDPTYKTTPAVHARRALEVHGRTGCADVLKLLETPHKARNTAWKPLMDAAFLGDAAKVQKLLAGGADPNVISATGHRYRPLHRAIEQKKLRKRGADHDEVVKRLLDARADPRLRGTYGDVTALQLAATGEYRFVPLLLKHFEPLDIFHAAAVGDERRVAELLRQDRKLAGANDVSGRTALHYCCRSSAHKLGKEQSDALVNIAKMLLKAGADANASHLYDGKWPIPPLYYATGEQNNVAVAEVLLEAGASPYDGESIYHSADEGHRESLALLEKYTKQKPLATECSKAIANLMHWNHSRGVPWLLAHGADPNYVSPQYGDSALHSAVKRRASADVLSMMLAHGGDPKLKNADGKSALDLAKGKPRVLRMLKEGGR